MASIPIMLAILIVVGIDKRNGHDPLITGIIICSFSTPVAILFIRSVVVRLQVDRAQVVFPFGFQTIRIATADVAGVGLVYRIPPPAYRRSPPAWIVPIWDHRGSMVFRLRR